jgi:hypothetical protein
MRGKSLGLWLEALKFSFCLERRWEEHVPRLSAAGAKDQKERHCKS